MVDGGAGGLNEAELIGEGGKRAIALLARLRGAFAAGGADGVNEIAKGGGNSDAA